VAIVVPYRDLHPSQQRAGTCSTSTVVVNARQTSRRH
jgi:hypothetical protein